MQAALRSDRSALGLLALLITILGLPVLLSFSGLPPRVEAYKSVATTAGTMGAVVQAIYQTPPDTDVVFLGSSLVTAGVSRPMVEQALTDKLHREASVQMLAMNWPGLDLQYYMLRDFLTLHKVRLLVWNLPEPHSRAYDTPHIQSYRWIRFGEYSDALSGLPLKYQAALYGEMVIGAPRQLLSKIRPNLIADEARAVDPSLANAGYYGAPFVPDTETPETLPATAPKLSVEGPPPGPYQMHYAKLILDLAHKHGCSVVLLHVPIDAEFSDETVPELADWQKVFSSPLLMIGSPAARLYPAMDRARFQHFYRDTHMNTNGQAVFTRAIIPSILEAYERQPAIQ